MVLLDKMADVEVDQVTDRCGLHGARLPSGEPYGQSDPTSVLRMVPIARRVARAGRGRLAVFRLLNSVRGWDSHHTPVDDVRWALSELRALFGHLPPTGLVGHSLGGRAALLAGDESGVRSVVALNPWVYPADGAALSGREILIVHGSADRIARPDRSASVARRLARTASVSYVRVDGGKHSMLRRHEVFDALASDFTAKVLLRFDADFRDKPDERWRVA